MTGTNNHWHHTISISALILIKGVMQFALYRQGFISVSADEFSRGISAAEWALQPHVDVLADLQQTWLPLEKYLNGSLLMIWPDAIWTPRLTVFIFSCVLLVALYALVCTLFESPVVAALAGVFIVFQPWYAWLSGTPMLEMYYLAFFFAGLLFLVQWLRETRKGRWFWAGACFLLASGFHVQAWALINLTNLLTLPFLWEFVGQKKYGHLWRLIACYVIGNSLIAASELLEFVSTHRVLRALSEHTSYSKWFYRGYDVSLGEKLLYYPRLVIEHSSVAVWVLLLLALIFIWREQSHRRWKLFMLCLTVLTLGLNSVMNVLSVPATAAPARYSLLYVLTLTPYVAYGSYRLYRLGTARSLSKSGLLLRGLSAILFLYAVGWGAFRISDYPHGMSLDAIETGRQLNLLLTPAEVEESARYMVELRYWDFLGVRITAGYYDATVYDRTYNPLDRNIPSIFDGEPGPIYDSLMSQNIRYVALCDPDLIARVQHMDFLQLREEVGSWRIYQFSPNL